MGRVNIKMDLRRYCCCLVQTACKVFGVLEILYSLDNFVIVLWLMITGDLGKDWTEIYMEFMDFHFEEEVKETKDLKNFLYGCTIFSWIALVLSFILMTSSVLLIYGACHKQRGFFLPILIAIPIQTIFRMISGFCYFSYYQEIKIEKLEDSNVPAKKGMA